MEREGGAAAVEHLEQQLGQQVRGVRLTRKLTQQQVADLANTSLGAVKNLESGRGANLRTLMRILRALEVEDWIGTLHAPRPAFNPLDLLAAGAPVGRRRGARVDRSDDRKPTRGQDSGGA